MKYKILYSKTNSSALPMVRYEDTKGTAIEIAERLKASGYTVNVWEVSEAGAKQIL